MCEVIPTVLLSWEFQPLDLVTVKEWQSFPKFLRQRERSDLWLLNLCDMLSQRTVEITAHNIFKEEKRIREAEL